MSSGLPFAVIMVGSPVQTTLGVERRWGSAGGRVREITLFLCILPDALSQRS